MNKWRRFWAGRWDRVVHEERARQILLGYTDEHDDEVGIDHLLMWAEEYFRCGKPVKGWALVRAARGVIVRQNFRALRESGSSAPLAPGIYRGGSPAIFGLWRLREDGVWLFCVPVVGETWRVAAQQTGDGLTPLSTRTTTDSRAASDERASTPVATSNAPGFTTEQIRQGYADDGGAAEYHDPINGHLQYGASLREFDAWLAAHDVEVRVASLLQAAALVVPSNHPSDWTEYAEGRADAGTELLNLLALEQRHPEVRP